MAAYAAVVSLMHTIDQLENHPSPPVSLHKLHVQSLIEKVSFFQNFLETYHSPLANGDEADPLEMRIADAAHAAEDIIESCIVDVIELRRSTPTYYQEIDSGEGTSSSAGLIPQRKSKISFDYFGCLMKPVNHGQKVTLYQGLRKVIKDMSAIKKEVMKIKNETTEVEAQLQRNVSTSAAPSSSRSSDMVGMDDVLHGILEKIAAEEHDRQVIPIVGMGGIGKTTLARHVYAHPFVKDHFDICAWATISQQYNTKDILQDLICQANTGKTKEELSRLSTEEELGSVLHQHLFSRRFLIVMDDMWSIDAWDNVQRFFPDNGNRSRVVVTTRLSNLGSQLDSNYCLKMNFLDDVSSWDLFSKTVFGKECCPTELKEIGKKIVETCQGLPLSIVVMGGLLKNQPHRRELWELIMIYSSSLVNSENEDFCLKILKLSYDHLPVYLKPCFLYMGVFEEDRTVRVSTLVKLWISEGFLKPVIGKSLENIAREYLHDLVDRNLILVHEMGSIGNIKYCKIHDLLRDLCRRLAEKEKFYTVIGQHKLNSQRRVVIHASSSKEEVDDAMLSMPFARSFLCGSLRGILPSLPDSKLLRIVKGYDTDTYGGCESKLEDLFGFVNSRFLAVKVQDGKSDEIPSSVGLLWNLQTLIILQPDGVFAPDELWKMPQLRHVECHRGQLCLRDPPIGNIVIMKNLQTLKGVCNLKCEEASKIIPNIKKLEVATGLPSNLICLSKLESFRCSVVYNPKCTFPYSLKKLSLSNTSYWELNEDMQEKLGALPLLEKLKLRRARFQSGKLKEWETSEDQFPSLKYLELNCCLLVSWKTESSHFPRLEQLRLDGLQELEEIPPEIGEITTLRSIRLNKCNKSAVVSAKKIVEEQEYLQGDELPFHIRVVPMTIGYISFEQISRYGSEERACVVVKEEAEAIHKLAGLNFTVTDN